MPPIPSIRSAGPQPGQNPGAHAGLVLTRCLPAQHTEGEKRTLTDHYGRVVGVPLPAEYDTVVRRWKEALQGRSAHLLEGTLVSPMAIGLGNESATEVGLTLHHTYGTPIVPGSALKGLCRRTAYAMIQDGAVSVEQFARLFGRAAEETYELLDTAGMERMAEQGGEVVFHDAWILSAPNHLPLKRDVVTVHHPDYYQGKDTPPGDFDDPNPVPFVVVRPGCRFLFALEAPDAEWAEFALEMLKWSLETNGIGGKTNAGYGRFDFTVSAAARAVAASEERWPDAAVTRNASSGALMAIRAGSSERAELRQPNQVTELLATLPEAARELLEKPPRKLTGVAVVVERRGRQLLIKRIETES